MILSDITLYLWFIGTYMSSALNTLTNCWPYLFISFNELFIPPYSFWKKKKREPPNSSPKYLRSQFLQNSNETGKPQQKRSTESNNSILQELRIFTMSPRRHMLHLFETDAVHICVDTGASSSATMDANDFIPGTYREIHGMTINGIAEGLSVKGVGSVMCILK